MATARASFAEAARVLKPDGAFALRRYGQAGTPRVDGARCWRLPDFDAEFRDITDNVAEACRLDSPRRREVIRRHAPFGARMLLKRQLENYAAIEGSAKFSAFAEGRRKYLMTAATKG